MSLDKDTAFINAILKKVLASPEPLTLLGRYVSQVMEKLQHQDKSSGDGVGGEGKELHALERAYRDNEALQVMTYMALNGAFTQTKTIGGCMMFPLLRDSAPEDAASEDKVLLAFCKPLITAWIRSLKPAFEPKCVKNLWTALSEFAVKPQDELCRTLAEIRQLTGYRYKIKSKLTRPSEDYLLVPFKEMEILFNCAKASKKHLAWSFHWEESAVLGFLPKTFTSLLNFPCRVLLSGETELLENRKIKSESKYDVRPAEIKLSGDIRTTIGFPMCSEVWSKMVELVGPSFKVFFDLEALEFDHEVPYSKFKDHGMLHWKFDIMPLKKMDHVIRTSVSEPDSHSPDICNLMFNTAFSSAPVVAMDERKKGKSKKDQKMKNVQSKGKGSIKSYFNREAEADKRKRSKEEQEEDEENSDDEQPRRKSKKSKFIDDEAAASKSDSSDGEEETEQE